MHENGETETNTGTCQEIESDSIHAQAIINGLNRDVLYCSNITNTYVQSGSLSLATKAFDQITAKNLHSWNTIISGYSKYSIFGEVLKFFSRLRNEGIAVDSFNLVFAVKASQRMLLLHNGRLLHCLALKSRLEGDLFIVPALLEMYVELGSLNDAHKLFERYSYRSSVIWGFMIKGLFEEASYHKDVVLWSVVINGSAKKGRYLEAMSVFKRMLENSITPNPVTLAGAILACSGVGSLKQGKSVHGFVIRNGVD
ncbi:pentatricopeptide repeat-containing protein At1g06140, mitochondrial-like [Abrus precatorius]|uniref:Pentatricopeptide repeat-containing protein At1g06140, mitochondrial-like n=1 Tax=Abrus precatorius TaxID=3816 RepID=A0A8B8KYQ8_ABRPR|nr:pentatricopeptide repeat-containing protein At1g06140, mitochondrial-like [Abrus precatorius]